MGAPVQHGWQFAGSGAAVELPQSQPGTAKATACSSGRSCAVAYPTAQQHGLLWVWLEAGDAGRTASAAVPLPVLPTADQEGREWFEVSPWRVGRSLKADLRGLHALQGLRDCGDVVVGMWWGWGHGVGNKDARFQACVTPAAESCGSGSRRRVLRGARCAAVTPPARQVHSRPGRRLPAAHGEQL